MSDFSRRRLLRTGAAASVLAATGLPARSQAKRGGTLRLGIGGATRFDNWDARTQTDTFMAVCGHGAVFDCLTEIAASGELVGELAESWEATPDARTWTFSLRRGVAFHDGSPFGAEDVIESLALHVAPGSASPARPIVETIEAMRALGPYRLRITLAAGNADFPFLLSDRHLVIYPAGRIAAAMRAGIGTGLYRVDRFEPGQRFVGQRVSDHYKGESAGFFDSVEVRAINDARTRMAALHCGQVDAVNRVDPAVEDDLRATRRLRLLEVTGNRHLAFAMRTDRAPFDDADVRRALKHAIDRPALVRSVLGGHGSVANDHPVGPANQYFAADLPQAAYDPERARHHLKRAGLSRLPVTLSVSEAAFPGARRAATLYRDNAAASGIEIEVQTRPAEGYWHQDWPTAPWRATAWAGRPTEDWMLMTAWAAGAPWNDTGWADDRMQRLLVQARATMDTAARSEMYREMQRLCALDGGAVIPAYANYLDAHATALANSGAIGSLDELDSARIAERWWFA